MKRIVFPLKLRMKRSQVADLHEALALIGLQISGVEKESLRFGASTRDAVRKFQADHSLSVTGIVDEATAQALNGILADRGVLDEDATCVIRGVLHCTEGKTAGLKVQAFDRDVSRDDLLGSTVTDEKGTYCIKFTESQFKRTDSERGGPEVFIRVSNEAGEQLGQSAIVRGAPQELCLDLDLPIKPIKGFIVHGHVTTSEGKPATDMILKAFDRNVGIDDTLLGQAALDVQGQYCIAYTLDQLHGKSVADLVISLHTRGGDTPLRTTDVIFNAGPDTVQDFQLPAPSLPVISEFERLKAKIKPLLLGSSWGKLDGKQITFLSRKTGLDAGKIGRLVKSEHLSKKNMAMASFYYALLADGKSIEPEAILKDERASIVRSVNNATEHQLIPPIGNADLDHILDVELPRCRGLNLLKPAAIGQRASLGDLINTLSESDKLDDADRHSFATAFGKHGHSQALWDEAKSGDYASKIPALQRTLALDEVTLGHGSLVAALQERYEPNMPESIAYLAKLARRDFLDLALSHGAPAASALSAVEYGFELERTVERRFPMVFLRERLISGDIKIKRFPTEAVVSLLTQHPDFDPAAERADAFLERVGAKSSELSVALRNIQRVHALSGGLRTSAALLNAGLDSALAVSRAGSGRVVACLSAELDADAARAVYDKARNLTMTNAAVVARYSPLYNRHAIPAIPLVKTGESFLVKYPNLRALFGDQDYCACRHCQSVLSPAAYLTDLLHFLQTSSTISKPPFGHVPKPFYGLSVRRPDLSNLLLTCENTNTEIPYIDLVLEILENTVALPMITTVTTSQSAKIVVSLESGEVPEEIRDALAQTAITIGKELSVIPVQDPWDLLASITARNGMGWQMISCIKSIAPLKLVRIDDDARRWIAGYVPKLFFISHDQSNYSELELMEVDTFDVEAAEADLKQGRAPAEILQYFGKYGLPCVATVKAMPPDIGNEWPISVAGEISMSVGVDLVLPNFVASGITPKVTLLDPKGQLIRSVIVSESSLDLIRDWLEGKVFGRLDRIAVMSLLELPGLNWRKTWDGSQGRWQLRYLFSTMRLYITEAILGIFSLTYRSSSIQTDLAAVPENRNPAAYKVLRETFFPWTLPLDLPTEEIRVYLRELGVSRQHLMDIAGVAREYAPYSCEVLGLSMADVEVADRYKDAPWNGWGLGGNWLTRLQVVSTLLQQSGLSYRELLDVRQTGSGLVAWAPILPLCECHPSNMQWVIDEPQLAWIHTFTHLWRKTGWFMRELNGVLQSIRVGPDGSPLDVGQVLHPLALAARLSTELKLPLLQVAAILGCLETTPWVDHITEGEPASPSLHDSVFQRSALRASESFVQFAFNPESGELSYLDPKPDDTLPTRESLTQHSHFLAASLGITPDYVEQLVKESLQSDELTFANLTLLFGNVAFCRGLGLSAEEFIRWTTLLENPFKCQDFVVRANALLAFAEDVKFARGAKTSLDELDYLLRHDLKGEFADAETRIFDGLSDIRDALQKGAVLGDVSIENLVTQLRKLGAGESLLAAIAGEAGLLSVLKAEVPVDSEPLPELPTELGSRFYYRKNRVNELDSTVWLGCRGIVEGSEFAKLPSSLATKGKAAGDVLKGRYEFIRGALSSQLNWVIKQDSDSIPTVPQLHVPLEPNSQVVLPEDLLSIFELKEEDGTRMLIVHGILAPEQRKMLEEVLPDLSQADVQALGEQADAVIKSGIRLLEPKIVDGLLTERSASKTRAVLLALVPVLETDILASQFSGVLELDLQTVQYLLANVRVSRGEFLGPTAIELLTDPVLLTFDASQKLDPAKYSEQIQVIGRLHKAARLLRGSNLTAQQLDWLNGNSFDVLTFNYLPSSWESRGYFASWRTLKELMRFKDAVAGGGTTVQALADLLMHAVMPAGTAKLFYKLAAPIFANAYTVDKGEVEAACELLNAKTKGNFSNPTRLLQVIGLLHLLKLLGTTVEVVKELTSDAPGAAAAMAARKLFMAQFDPETLPKRLQPISDKLRVRQRDALVTYLKWRDQLPDENALLDYYLIDVKMEPCMRTSRIKQAISSVQLFIQRCLLNLESQAPTAVAPSDIDTTQWRWMRNYRVWEANRKVFLYPENWIEPDLRDDKTEIFKTLEANLLQEDLTHGKALDVFAKYLEDAAGLAKLTVLDLEVESVGEDDVVHFLAVDQGRPRNIYYRTLRLKHDISKRTALQWTPWEKVDGDIAGDHAVIFKVGPFLHIGYPVLSSDDDVSSRKVGFAVRRKTQDGWTSAKQSSQFLRMAIHPNKSPGSTIVLSKARVFDAVNPISRVHVYAPSKLVSLVSNTINAPYEKLTDGVLLTNLTLRIRVLERLVDSLGNSFLRTIDSPLQLDFVVDRGGYFHNGQWVDPSPSTCSIIVQNGKYDFGPDDITSLPTRPKIPDQKGAWCCNSIKITASGSPGRHTKEKIILSVSTTNLDLGASGEWITDIVFSVKPEISTEVEFPPDRYLDNTLEYLGYFGVSKDFAISMVKPPVAIQPDSTSTIPNTEHFGPGYMRLASVNDQQPLTIDRRDILEQTHGRYFSVVSYQYYYFDIAAYRDNLHSLIFIRVVDKDDNSVQKYRVMSLGQDWTLDNGVKALAAAPRDAIDLQALPAPEPQNLLLGSGAWPPGSTGKLVPVFNSAFPASSNDWETFFHVPLLVAVQLSQAQRFEDAQRWFHTIFDPTSNDREEKEAKRYWRFPPFREAGQGEGIDLLLEWLAEDNPQSDEDRQQKIKALEAEIDVWKNNPFNPHLIARSRIRAYQWTVVIKYIENLIAWGDQLFRRDTIETINEATQLYVLAARILGPRPASIPRCSRQARSYLELAYTDPGMDDFSNAWVALEDAGTGACFGNDLETKREVPDMPHGLYFGIPHNSGIEQLWNTVDERLFNIRHCRNIDGIERQLPLFEPPIDPALLVRAAAQGLDLSAILADLGAPLPLHRFTSMLPKAFEICADLRALGGAVLQALEKKDAEELALLRNSHEIALLKLAEQIRQRQIDEAEMTLQGLVESRRTAEERYNYYQKLLGRADASAPERDEGGTMEPSLTPLAKVGLEGLSQGLGVSQTESAQLQLLRLAQVTAMASGVSSTTAGVLLAVGGVLSALPRGSCPGLTLGDMGGPLTGAGHAANAVAGYLSTVSGLASSQAGMEAIIGGYERRRDEWIFQSNMALREMAQIDRQWTSADIRKEIAEKELANTRRQVENARSIDEFFRSKYSSAQLYRYMSGQLVSLYFRTYQLALEVAKRAERCFQFELEQPNASFIKTAYWDSTKKGLLSGEQLHFDLRRMDLAYLESHKREFELTKHVSFMQIDPLALIVLRETGRCEFHIPEVWYDLDCPGHYMRRIKSVSLTIPCVMGPYAGVHCTLTLLSSSVRKDPGGQEYENDFSSIQSIVTSGGQADAGLFETNLRDERYLPFEGAGAISTWRLELPPSEIRQFDYDTISDVILHMRYTAREGGEQLRTEAVERVKLFSGSVMTRLFSLRHQFPTDWGRLTQPSTAARSVTFAISARCFPFFVQGRNMKIKQVDLFGLPANNEDVGKTLPGLVQPSAKTVVISATTTKADPKLTSVSLSDLALLQVGMPITGTNIGVGAIISKIDEGTCTVTLSVDSTGSDDNVAVACMPLIPTSPGLPIGNLVYKIAKDLDVKVENDEAKSLWTLSAVGDVAKLRDIFFVFSYTAT